MDPFAKYRQGSVGESSESDDLSGDGAASLVEPGVAGAGGGGGSDPDRMVASHELAGRDDVDGIRYVTMAERVAELATLPDAGCPVGLWPNVWVESPEEFGEVAGDGGGDSESGRHKSCGNATNRVATEKIPLPEYIQGPCTASEACRAIEFCLLFWEDRFGKVHCAGCEECPSRVLLKRFLFMQGPADWRTCGAAGLWLVEAELERNPWAGRKAAAAGKGDSTAAGSEGF